MQSNQREQRARKNERERTRARSILHPTEAFPLARALDRPVSVPSVVGVTAGELATLGPAYTLSPEPMTDTPQLDARGCPRSVWSALLTLSAAHHETLVRLVYGCTRVEARGVLLDTMLFEATQTRRFEPGPDGGWAVWIDEQGRGKVLVYP